MRFQSPPPTILTLEQLADMLQVSAPTAEKLAVHHHLPHVRIAGSPRFLATTVIAWLEGIATMNGVELVPPSQPEPVVPPVAPPSVHTLPRLNPGEKPWLDAHVLTALAAGAADPGRNLDRLRLRDALLELNDELLPVITRLSGGRLHTDPHEQTRTSPWRLEGEQPRPITVMSIAWGAGPTGAPQFQDRPRIQIEVMDGLLRVALELEGRHIALARTAIDGLESDGFAVDSLGEDPASVAGVARVYKLVAAEVSAAAVAAALARDLEPLVDLWSQAADRS